MLSLIMVLSGASLKAQAVHEIEFPDYDYKTSSILVTPNSAGKVVDVGDGYFSLLLDFDTETLELGRIDKKGITTLATMKKDEEIFTYVPRSAKERKIRRLLYSKKRVYNSDTLLGEAPQRLWL